MNTGFSLRFLTLTGFLFLMFSCNTAKSLDNDQLLSVEIEMTDRGNSIKNTIDQNAVTRKENVLGEEESFSGIFKRNPEEWDEISRAVSKLDLNKFESREAPTQKRLYDGARSTVITLNFKDKTLTSQAFDEGEPPAEFRELYGHLVSVVNQ